MSDESMIKKLNAWDTLELLRAPEGNEVTIPCDNPDGDMVVICSGDFTDWEERRFTGDNVFDCLAKARAAQQLHDKANS